MRRYTVEVSVASRVLLTTFAALLASSCTDYSEKYRSIFLAVDGVMEVSDFLWYEKHTSAALVLAENRYIHIMEFDETVASTTDFIELFQIGDIVIRCGDTPQARNIASGVFNILEVMRASPLRLELQNIGDIIDHYDEISDYLEEELPTHAVVNDRFVVDASTRIETKRGEFWCSRHTSTEREGDAANAAR
jgi:hypothetical protein